MSKPKYAVTVRADKNIQIMTDMTFPIIEEFCNKWNADFILLDQQPIVASDDNHPHFRILKVGELLEIYDRVLNLDADLIINTNCPNLFELVPEDSIGVIYEDVGSRVQERLNRMQKIQADMGQIGWAKGYINSGVILVSKPHSNIFNPINGKFFTADGSDDVHLGYQIHKQNHKVFELDYRFNHMTMFSEPWSNKNRFDSFIIHYAGRGIFESGIGSRNEQIKQDIDKIYGTN